MYICELLHLSLFVRFEKTYITELIYTYIHIYIYIYIYTEIYLYIYIHKSLYISIYRYLIIRIHKYIYIYRYTRYVLQGNASPTLAKAVGHFCWCADLTKKCTVLMYIHIFIYIYVYIHTRI